MIMIVSGASISDPIFFTNKHLRGEHITIMSHQLTFV